MALDGYCLHLDLPQLRRMAYLLQMCSNNLNQYAKVANEDVYKRQVLCLREKQHWAKLRSQAFHLAYGQESQKNCGLRAMMFTLPD